MNNLEFGSENVEKKGHPAIVVAHLGFRVSALFIYMFGGVNCLSFFSDSICPLDLLDDFCDIICLHSSMSSHRLLDCEGELLFLSCKIISTF